MSDVHQTLKTPILSETEAQAIQRRNERTLTQENRRKRDIRRAIEARQDAKALGVDYDDLQ